MSLGRLAALLALIAFVGFNVYASYVSGLDGLIAELRGAGVWVWVLLADLTIALSLVGVWLYRDARQHERWAVPYLVATLLTGSAAPLLYLVRRASPQSPDAS